MQMKIRHENSFCQIWTPEATEMRATEYRERDRQMSMERSRQLRFMNKPDMWQRRHWSKECITMRQYPQRQLIWIQIWLHWQTSILVRKKTKEQASVKIFRRPYNNIFDTLVKNFLNIKIAGQKEKYWYIYGNTTEKVKSKDKHQSWNCYMQHI